MGDYLVSFRFDFEVAGEKQVSRELLRFGSHASDARPVFHKLHEKFLRIETAQFRTEGGRSSGGWAPLKDSTIASKAAKGLDPRILHATLALSKSLTKMGDKNQVVLITDQFMVFGSNLEYLAPHQLGAPGSNLPRRRPLEFTKNDRVEIMRTIQKYIVTGKV